MAHPGNLFGTWRDGEDAALIGPVRSIDQVRMDHGLTALAEPMPSGAAAVFAACVDGFDQGRDALTWHYMTAHRRRSESTVEIAQSIILRAIWRRRNYVAHHEDCELDGMLVIWPSFARKLELGESLPEDALVLDPDAKLPDGLYAHGWWPDD